MATRKTPEQIADEERRYELARSARTPEEFEALVFDSNQAIRAAAAHNPAADAASLAKFARDRFWGVRIEVAKHPNTPRSVLLELLEPEQRKRGVVHHEAVERLISEGVRFGEDGRPVS